ncbi:hypothetical protein MTO98_10155 [Mucilaginibacter sp. SMC90]|nr:hypothetical protein [Mucilaginibacter sp. SMC90]UOE51439.1 hypothetical protein MTO98_10155 [Mucilaginibacter sp. SMC90]
MVQINDSTVPSLWQMTSLVAIIGAKIKRAVCIVYEMVPINERFKQESIV